MTLPRKVVDSLRSKTWMFSHHFDRSTKIMMLDESGKVLGYNGANESRWEVEEGKLFFIGPSGQRSIVFDRATRRFNLLVLEGYFIDHNLSGAQVILEEAHGIEYLAPVSASEVAKNEELANAPYEVPYRRASYGEETLDGDGYTASAVHLATIDNASVISRYGATRVGKKMLTDTAFQHPFFLTAHLVEDRHAGFLHIPPGDAISIDRALLVCGGVYDNYYHWLMFLIAKVRSPLLQGVDTIITSQATKEFQKSGMTALAKKHGLKVVSLMDGSSVHVAEIKIAYQPLSNGLDPHPAILEPIQDVKAVFLDGDYCSPELIYISRSDTAERKLGNECDIERLLAARGFTIVSFTGRSLKEQVNIMHRARIVVSPHGAGLTNVVFCQAGAKVLEFQNPAHINWCMKRLATINGIEYGFIMGKTTRESRNEYAVDPAKLEKALDAMGV